MPPLTRCRALLKGLTSLTSNTSAYFESRIRQLLAGEAEAGAGGGEGKEVGRWVGGWGRAAMGQVPRSADHKGDYVGCVIFPTHGLVSWAQKMQRVRLLTPLITQSLIPTLIQPSIYLRYLSCCCQLPSTCCLINSRKRRIATSIPSSITTIVVHYFPLIVT